MSKALKKHKLVEEVEDDRANDNGWWAYLKPGWRSLEQTHQVHEDTVRECLEQLRYCEPCDCDECKQLQAAA